MTSGSVLALDFGTKRIGVAVGETSRGIAHPLRTIAYPDNARRMAALAALMQEWQPALVVVGVPHGADGRPHPLRPAIDRFVRRLRARFGVPVETVDEHLSSWQASRRLSESGVRAARQRPMLDAVAACTILETWFEQVRAETTPPAEGR
jgi:putative Holliday junction resolvase